MESRERQAYWVGVINEARSYRDGISAYLREYKISKPLYYSWFRKLRHRHDSWSEDLTHAGRKKAGGVTKGETEVSSKPARRKFTRAEKERILKAYEAAADGQKGAVLRREGIYQSHLQKWRKELAEGGAKKRGPRPNPAASEIKQLKAELERTKKQLHRANQLIDIQKKVSALLGIALDSEDQAED